MKVLVLGAGPTGLVAAHAAFYCGADVTVKSKAVKSNMFGAQYLHEPIPGIDAGRPTRITYRLDGTIDQYRNKVYGPDYKGTVSPDDYEGDHMACDIRRTYDNLWRLYSDLVETDVVTMELLMYEADWGNWDYILNTIPAPQFCDKGHTFAGQDIYAMGDTDEPRVPVSLPPMTVVCNGLENPSWYRASNIFGYRTVEWVKPPPIPGISKVRKPIFNNCTCHPNVTRLGRFGMWRKGVLVHHAFNMTLDLLTGQMRPEETRPHAMPCPLADEELTADAAIQMGCRCE